MGGIGMSGLAQIMKIMGFKVQGSDISMNKNIENCKALGIRFFLGQKKKNIKDATILVKSSAIKSNNQEIKEAKKEKLPIYERVEMLANIVSLKKYNYFRFTWKNNNNIISFKNITRVKIRSNNN